MTNLIVELRTYESDDSGLTCWLDGAAAEKMYAIVMLDRDGAVIDNGTGYGYRSREEAEKAVLKREETKEMWKGRTFKALGLPYAKKTNDR